MHLGNASHLSAPEPGPASYLWFRVEYEDDRKDLHWRWVKVPDVDERTGKPRYPVALQYQRMLAMTEQSTRADPSPPMYTLGPDGKLRLASFYRERWRHNPVPPLEEDDKEQPKKDGQPK